MNPTYIGDDGKLGYYLQDIEPHPNVLRPLRDRPPQLTDKFLGIQSDLKPVVEDGKDGGKRKGSHKDGDEAKLDDWQEKNEN